MFRTAFFAVAAVASLASLASGAHAQDQGGVKVQGITAVTTVANPANNVAFLGEAEQKIGGITGE
ncbi:MAG: hypothetical protein RID91_22655 [Azospirillaceae bacterium]